MGLKRNGRWILNRIRGRAEAPKRTRAEKIAPPAKPRPATGTELKADRFIRGVAIAILLAVAGAAAYVSYHHFYGLAILLGERHDMAILYPAMSDGVIVMASLVMVYCSRRGVSVPVGAWAALFLGCSVTLVANVAHGWSGGMGSRLLSALAPVAFVGAYELLMWLVRIARKAAAQAAPEVVAETVVEHVCQPEVITETVVETVTVLPVDRYEAARLAYEDSLKPGSKRLGWRPLSNRWGIEVQEAKDVIAEVDAERQEEVAEKASPEPPATPPASDASLQESSRELLELVAPTLGLEFTKERPPTEADLDAAELSPSGKFLVRRAWNMPDPERNAEDAEVIRQRAPAMDHEAPITGKVLVPHSSNGSTPSS